MRVIKLAGGGLQNYADFHISLLICRQDSFFWQDTGHKTGNRYTQRKHWCCMGFRHAKNEMSKIERYFDNTDDHLYHANVGAWFSHRAFTRRKNCKLVCFCFFYERLE